MRQRRCCVGHRSRRMVRAHRITLPGRFRNSPIGTAENGHTRFKEGKIVFIANQEAKIDQVKSGLP